MTGHAKYGDGRGLHNGSMAFHVMEMLDIAHMTNGELYDALGGNSTKSTKRGVLQGLKSRGMIVKKPTGRWEIVKPSK